MLRIVLIFFVVASPGYAWNSLGHRLVAQIACDNLEQKNISRLERYNHALDRNFKKQPSLMSAAPWLDSLRYLNGLWLEHYHYINLPFSRDNTTLIKPVPDNAITAIKQAKKTLHDPNASLYNKGFSLRILLHVVGDLHQPLHAISEYSKIHPHGDLGGNLFALASNDIGTNLHKYWDEGGGFLVEKKVNAKRLKELAEHIEKKWPCAKMKNANMSPESWAKESHALALAYAYSISPGQNPDSAYQKHAQEICEKRIAFAGCRLANLLRDVST